MRPNRRRYLDEVYCAVMRQLGSHGTWEPEKWLWPGDTGLFRRGVFTRLDRLPEDWKLDIQWTDAPAQTFGLDEAWEREDAVKGGASDLFEVLSASGEFERKVSGADELVFLARRGRWWSIRNVNTVLERIQQELEHWRIAETLICSVFETPSAAIALSSRSTGAFVVRVDANGVPHIGVRARGGVQTERTSLLQSRRPMQLRPKKADGQCAPEDATPEERSEFAYTPLFGDGYRIAKHFWGLFGRASLTTLDGDPIQGKAARSEPEDLLFDPESAEMSLKEAKEIPIEDLFEEVTAELLSREVEAEEDTEVEDVPIQPMIDAGFEILDLASVPRYDVERLTKLKRRKYRKVGTRWVASKDFEVSS